MEGPDCEPRMSVEGESLDECKESLHRIREHWKCSGTQSVNSEVPGNEPHPFRDGRRHSVTDEVTLRKPDISSRIFNEQSVPSSARKYSHASIEPGA